MADFLRMLAQAGGAMSAGGYSGGGFPGGNYRPPPNPFQPRSNNQLNQLAAQHSQRLQQARQRVPQHTPAPRPRPPMADISQGVANARNSRLPPPAVTPDVIGPQRPQDAPGYDPLTAPWNQQVSAGTAINPIGRGAQDLRQGTFGAGPGTWGVTPPVDKSINPNQAGDMPIPPRSAGAQDRTKGPFAVNPNQPAAVNPYDASRWPPGEP